MRKLVIILVFFALMTFAKAVPVQWSGNSHYYEYVESEYITWSEADTAAQLASFMGVQGHLATITSEAEETLYFSIFPTG